MQLTPGRLRAGGADISQDGQQIVFFNNENYPGKNSIYVMNIDGSGITRLTNPGGFHHDVWPTFSPDGRYIVFASTRSNLNLCCYDVWRMNVDGSNAIPLTPNVAVSGCENSNCVYPTWKPAT
jgi:Tol biopolymer transport system component